MAAELTLEPPPPFASLACRAAPEQWEVQHSRLVDERWVEIILSKPKEMCDYQEKKMKLSSANRQKTGDEKGNPNDSQKGKGRGGKKGKGSEDGSPAAPPA